MHTLSGISSQGSHAKVEQAAPEQRLRLVDGLPRVRYAGEIVSARGTVFGGKLVSGIIRLRISDGGGGADIRRDLPAFLGSAR